MVSGLDDVKMDKSVCQLLVTKVMLQDKPYAIQVDALKWMKGIVSSWVRQILDSLPDDQHQPVTASDTPERVVMEEGSCYNVGVGVETCEDYGGVSPSNSKVRARASSPHTTAPDSPKRKSVSCTSESEGRLRLKRSRSEGTHWNPTEESLSAGMVVECFFDADGLWYPARIEPQSDNLPCAQDDGDRDDEVFEHVQVTFLGYGNQQRVPRNWVRKISSLEVKQWCLEHLEPGDMIVTGDAFACEGDDNADRTTSKHPQFAGSDECCEEGDCQESFLCTATDCSNISVSGDAIPHHATFCEDGGEDYLSRIGDFNDTGATCAVRHNKIDAKNEQPERGGVKGNAKGKGKGKKQKQKKKRKVKRVRVCPEDSRLEKIVSRLKSHLAHVQDKYWAQRYRYFSRFDRGIRLDNEGWFSVTPECIASHIAERCRCDVVVDPFVGCGGNAIQLAMTCHLVIAIDIDPIRLQYARHNASIYGVEDRIEFILGDAMDVLPTLRADVVFLSPPWGGPAYQSSEIFDLHTMIPPPLTALSIFKAAQAVTPNVAFFLPRNVDIEQVKELCLHGRSQENKWEGVLACEVEEQYLNGKLKTTTAYYGDLLIEVDASNEDKGRGAVLEPLGSVSVKGHSQGATPPGAKFNMASSEWSGHHIRFDQSDNESEGEDQVTQEGGVRSRCVVHGARSGVGDHFLLGKDEHTCTGSSCTARYENELYDNWIAAMR